MQFVAQLILIYRTLPIRTYPNRKPPAQMFLDKIEETFRTAVENKIIPGALLVATNKSVTTCCLPKASINDDSIDRYTQLS